MKYRIRELVNGKSEHSFIVEGSWFPFWWSDVFYNDYYGSHKYFDTIEKAKKSLEDHLDYIYNTHLSKKRTVRIHD